MIQTTLFNYFNCYNNNEQLKHPKCKSLSLLKQTNLTNYYKTIPKKRNLILNYFKPKEKEVEKEIFDLVLIDIKSTIQTNDIKCIKKNMYDEDLKYIAISYRWGEFTEQLIKTPDYIAHITSFDLANLKHVCYLMQCDTDLKEIQYVWVDAISVNQHNHARKKETILKMNQIYHCASYILAIPDLHLNYLLKNTANNRVIGLIRKYNNIIHQDIEDSTIHLINNNNDSTNLSLVQKKENEDNEELKEAYQFLAYLIDDWSNRVWVISEHQIAKEKYEKHGTPLKYMFSSLLYGEYYAFDRFFSYSFAEQHNEDTVTDYLKVDNGSKLVRLLESKFIQRPQLDMIITSNAARYEDRFYAIIPFWNDYNHLMKNKNKISSWNVSDMLSLKLKLYEVLNDEDLWNKARLLLYCTIYDGKPILPSFATSSYAFVLGEIDYVDYTHKDLLDCLSKYEININEKYNGDMKEYINDYHKEHGSIWKQNLMDIHFNQQYCYLSVKANQVYIFNKIPNLSQEELLDYSLPNNDDLQLIYIPYFTYTIPEFNDLFPINSGSCPNLSGTLLIGNMDINRWVLYPIWECEIFDEPSLMYIDDFTFNIY